MPIWIGFELAGLLTTTRMATVAIEEKSSEPHGFQPTSPIVGSSRSMIDFAGAQLAHKKRTGAYNPDADLGPDIEECKLSLQLFLESRMLESEQLLKGGDPKFERLYIATGYGLIECVKAFMSFDDTVSSFGALAVPNGWADTFDRISQQPWNSLGEVQLSPRNIGRPCPSHPALPVSLLAGLRCHSINP